MFIVKKDGKEKFRAKTYNECWMYIFRNQSSSVFCALTDQGWNISEE